MDGSGVWGGRGGGVGVGWRGIVCFDEKGMDLRV